MRSPLDDRLKLFATTMMLRFRRSHRELFDAGAYEAADADGGRRDHVFGFARALNGEHVLVVVPRLVASLMPDADVPPIGERVWGDTRIISPRAPAHGCYHNLFTNRCVQVQNEGGRVTLRAADVFDQFPIAVLEAR
jgi:(1->4)-alpha-D-glucan 1-alpha-D-glucosylmutase